MHMETRDWRMHNGIRASWHGKLFFDIIEELFNLDTILFTAKQSNLFLFDKHMADDAVGYGARVTRKKWPYICILQVNCSKNGESCPVRQLHETHRVLSVCGWESIILTFSIHVTRSVSVQSHSQSLTESQKEGHTRRFKLVILPNLFKFMWGQVRLPSSFKLKTWA